MLVVLTLTLTPRPGVCMELRRAGAVPGPAAPPVGLNLGFKWRSNMLLLLLLLLARCCCCCPDCCRRVAVAAVLPAVAAAAAAMLATMLCDSCEFSGDDAAELLPLA